MADDTERLVLEMSADLRRFQNSLDRANKAADRRFNALEKRALMAGTAIERTFSGTGDRIRQALAAIGVGLAVTDVANYADAWQNATNKLLAAGVAQEQVGSTLDRIVDIAKESRSAFDATADLYAKLTRAGSTFGASQVHVARAVETVNKALAASGATTAERNSAILQLGQGLSSGILQGDELRAIREASPVLAQAIADEFQTTIGGLKKLGSEGELTAERVFKAIIRGSQGVDAQFAKTTGTIRDAFTTLQTEATKFIGTQAQASGAAATLSGLILLVANNLELLASAAIVAGSAVGGVLLGRGLAGMVAGLTASAAGAGLTATALQAMGARAATAAVGMTALRGAMAFLGGPWGVAITAVSIALGVMATNAGKAAQPSAELTRTTDALGKALEKYEAAAVASSVATGKDAAAKRQATIETRKAVELEIQNVKAKLASAEASLKLAAAEGAALEARLLNDPASFGAEDPNSRLVRDEARIGKKRRQAAADRNAALASIAQGEKKLAEIRTALEKPLSTGGGGTGAGGGKTKRTGPTPQEIRQDIDLEAARISQNEDLTRELERQAFLREQAKRYEDSGLKAIEARRRAAADLADLEDARDVASSRELANIRDATELEIARAAEDEAGVRSLERRIELQDRIRELNEAGLDLATATANATAEQLRIDKAREASRARWLESTRQEHALEVARLAGDQERARLLERELFIRERVRDLMDQAGLNERDAGAQANREATELAEAELRGRFRAAFRDGVRAAIEGDLGGFLQSFTADIADRVLGSSLDVLADGLLNVLAKTFPELLGQISGDALGAQAAGAAMGAAIVTASTTGGTAMATAIGASTTASSATMATSIAGGGQVAAASMGGAIVAAGAQAAAAMAAAIAGASGGNAAAAAIGSGFGGFFAKGGNTRLPILNERGPEGFAQTTPGVVFSAAAMQSLADLGRLAKAGRIGGGETKIVLENKTGVPAMASAERQGDGSTRVTLEPLARSMIDGAGRSGLLRDSIKKTPPQRMRG